MQQAQLQKYSGKISNLQEKKELTSIFHERSKIDLSIKKSKQELKEILTSLMSGSLTFSYKGKICNAVPLDFHRCLTEWMRNSDLDLAIRNIIISSFFSAEVLAGGTGVLACALWLDELTEPVDLGRVSSVRIKNILRDLGRQGLSSTIANHLFEFGACGSEVFLKEGQQTGTKIEVLEGEEIKGHVDNLFLSSHPNVNISNDHYVVAINGIVENISQIHGLLESIGSHPAVIVASNFFPDVSNTFSENFSSGKLSIIPYVVESWGVENFLDLSSKGILCASTEIGSDLSMLRASEKIKAHVSPGKLVYEGKSGASSRKITVTFGKDLGSLAGISLDRTKILLSIMRLASRYGVSTCKIFGKDIDVATVSLQNAQRAIDSLNQNLHNLGGVISFSTQGDKQYVR